MNVPDSMDLSCAEKFSDPFSYVVVRQPFTHDLSIRLLQWLETEDSWKFVATDFYEQYEFSFSDVSLPESFSFFRDSSYLSSLKSKFETLFSVSLREQIDIVAHKLVSGHRIRIHNDYILGHETHRLTIQLNRGLRDDWGGWFVLFDGSNPENIHKIFRPLHNTALGFAISERSHHAVSPFSGGERYTLIFSLYEDLGEERPDR